MQDISEASRVIMWNVSHPANSIVMYMLFVISLIIAGYGVFSRVNLWCSGVSSPANSGRYLARIQDVFQWALLQKGVQRERDAGFIHLLMYFGFLVLTFATTMVLIHHDFGIEIYLGKFYLWVTVASDIFGLGLLLGVGAAVHRRLRVQPDFLHSRLADWLMLSILAVLCVQGFLIEALRIKVTHDPWALYSPVGYIFSKLFWGMSDHSALTLHFLVWWFHAITLFVGLALLPFTKFFHIVSSSLNLYFRKDGRPRGALMFPGDIEKIMEEASDDLKFGVDSIKDYSWKMMLDLDACTSCGRCQNVCPAYLSGKPLSPKWLILDSRNHMLKLFAEKEKISDEILKKMNGTLLGAMLLEKSGLIGNSYESEGIFRASSKAVQMSAREIGKNEDASISGQVMSSDVFWSCNTCYACVEACPVGIQHVDHIVENRRNMVLMKGEMPHEAQGTIRALESKKNPFGDPLERIKWAHGLDVKIVETGDSVDYLYWVGCVSAFDPRKQKIARSLVSLMKHAGLNFGVLGNSEGCSGDPARRLGEENLYQTLAKYNIETLKTIKFKTLVANCPHCFNTIKNEYPQLGNLGNGKSPEIIHHTVLLKRLVQDGKLSLKEGTDSFAFHDPCYLGRYNGEYEAPRSALKSVKGLKVLEMEMNKDKGLCCGAGGGHFWMDLKLGERINVKRAEMARDTGANMLATGCPFCLQMMEDGMKLTDQQTEVKDVAEVLYDHLSIE